MPHFYVDDGLHSNPKARAVSAAAMGLWTLAGSYSADTLSEGLVPFWFVRTVVGGARLARELVEIRVPGGEHGLWHGPGESCDSPKCPASRSPVPPDHFAFHDWAKINTKTKVVVERERDQSRERQQRFVQRHGGRSANGVSNDTQSSPVQGTTKSVSSRAIPHVSGSVDNYAAAVDFARARLTEYDGEPVTKSQAARVVDAILSRAASGTTPRNPLRYVKTALNRNPDEWHAHLPDRKEPTS